MKIETRAGGDGVRCWNVESLAAYQATIDGREHRLAAANPDVIVTAGHVTCYGCEVLDHDYGVRCTALLTRTLYAVRGEVGPRPEDAAGSLSEITGLVGRLESRPVPETPPSTPAAQVTTPSAPRSERRGLFRRSS